MSEETECVRQPKRLEIRRPGEQRILEVKKAARFKDEEVRKNAKY